MTDNACRWCRSCGETGEEGSAMLRAAIGEGRAGIQTGWGGGGGGGGFVLNRFGV